MIYLYGRRTEGERDVSRERGHGSCPWILCWLVLLSLALATRNSRRPYSQRFSYAVVLQRDVTPLMAAVNVGS